MNIHYLPFLASFIFFLATLFAIYRPGRIQGVLYSLVGFCASAWIFFIGYEYYLYSINSRDLFLIKISSFLVGVFSHVFVPIVIILSWKFPPVETIKKSTFYGLLAFCSFMAIISWWGIEMYFDGLAIVRRSNKTIMTIQGLWFAIGTGYGLFHLYRKRLTTVASRVREAQIRGITLSLTSAFVIGSLFTHFFSIFYSGKQLLHVNVIVLSGFITSIAYCIPMLIELFGEKLYYQKYDPAVVRLVNQMKDVSDKDILQKVKTLQNEGYDLSIISENINSKEPILYWEDYDFLPNSPEYKLLSKYDSEAILLKDNKLVCIHNGEKITYLKQKDIQFKKGDLGIYKDNHFQFIYDLVSGRVLTNYSNYDWSNIYVCSGYTKLHQIFIENQKAVHFNNTVLQSFQEYCTKNKLSLHKNYGLFQLESRIKTLIALSMYLRDTLNIRSGQ